MGKRSGKELMGTYETRLHVGEAVESALADYAGLFCRSERGLFALVSSGKSLTSLKKPFCRERRISSRMFNSLRVEVEGRIESRRASLLKQQEDLTRGVARARKVLAAVERRGDSLAVHGKKRRLANLESRLGEVERDIAEDRVRVCFGSRELFHAQYSLSANGYSSHEEWVEDWRSARSDSFFVLGSRDESGGNQACVATVREDGRLDLRLRLPDCLVGKHGKYLVFEGLDFNHGHHHVISALESCGEYRKYRSANPSVRQKDVPSYLGQAVSYRFKRDSKGWRVFASLEKVFVPVVTNRRLGAVGVDFNSDHLAVTETDFSGNWLNSFSVPMVTYGKSAKQSEAIVSDAVAEVIGYARVVGKPVAFEKLDFSQKRAELEGRSPKSARTLSSLGYGRFQEYVVSRGQREGVEVVGVNPAFSSVMGRVKYMERLGLTVHQAAAYVLARRLLGYSESVPDRVDCPDGDGARVTFTVPEAFGLGKRLKHVWTLWGMISGRLIQARVVRRRRGPPLRAPSRPGSGPCGGLNGVSGGGSRAEPPCAVGAAAGEQPRLAL